MHQEDIESYILNKMLEIKDKDDINKKEYFLNTCLSTYGIDFNIAIYILKNFENYKIDLDKLIIFEKELKNANLEDNFYRLEKIPSNNENDKFKNIFCDYSIENLKFKKEENKENLKSIFTQIGKKYGFKNLNYNDLEQECFSEKPFFSTRLKVDGNYGKSDDLKQTNKELFDSIVNLIKNIKTNYIKAQESLDLKIENIKEYQIKIGLEINDFKF